MTAATAAERPVAGAERELVRRLRAALPLIGRADLTPAPEGWVAVIHLDPLLVRSRAEQQGLDDESLAAAVASPRVRRAVAQAVEAANADAPPQARIARHQLAG